MFRLNIECTKDINELHINFADGSSVITGPSNHAMGSTSRVHGTDAPSQSPTTKVSKEDFLDLDADFGSVSQEVVKPPEINRSDRPVKVASELQNLDI